jgi:PAS domain S-box-containing protein
MLLELVESISDGVMMVDRDWRIIYTNRQTAARANLQPEDLLGRNLWEQFPALRGTVWEENYRAAMEDRQPRGFEGRGVVTGGWFSVQVYPTESGLLLYARDTGDARAARRELAQSEARFRALADTVPAMIWMSDEQNLGVYYNRPWLEFAGRPIDAELGLGWAERIHPEDRERALATCMAAFEKRDEFRMELRLRRHDGQYRWLLDHGVPRFDEGGRFAGYIGSCVDITDRKVAERRIAAEHAVTRVLSEPDAAGDLKIRLLQALGENLGCQVGLLWRLEESGHFLRVNRVWVNHAEFSESFTVRTRGIQYVRGQGLPGRVWATRRPVWVTDIAHVGDTGGPRRPGLKRLRTAFALPVGDAGGFFGAMEFFTIDRLEPDPSMLDSLAAIGSEIAQFSRRREAEFELIRSRQRLDLAQQTGKIGTFDWDVRNDRVAWSAELEELYGLPPGGFGGAYEAWAAMVVPDDLAAMESALSWAMEMKEDWNQEIRVRRADGQERWILATGRFLFDETGLTVRAVGVHMDITELKQAEENLRALNERLEHRVAERTAELREYQQKLRNLASELVVTEQRERRRIAEGLHDHLGQLLAATKMVLATMRTSVAVMPETQKSLNQAMDLLTQAIQYTRTLTSELSPPVLYDLGLEAALQWLAQQFRGQYGLHVIVKAEPDAEPKAEESRLALFTAAREALFNCVKHAKTQTAEVTLSREDALVKVVVEDRGVGFDPAAKRSGDGFGLFNIRERLDLLGGGVRIESQKGKGTRVTLKAPVEVQKK